MLGSYVVKNDIEKNGFVIKYFDKVEEYNYTVDLLFQDEDEAEAFAEELQEAYNTGIITSR